MDADGIPLAFSLFDGKQKLYGGSFSRLKQKQVELNESLLPHSVMKKESKRLKHNLF